MSPKEVRARLPNLIVIGAAKCGTSALHSYLAAHPEIGMSERKEVMFFGGHWAAPENLAGYATYFPADARVRGESSPTYSMWPWVDGVPEQMSEWLTDPRFIYVVGDPVPRVVAHWAEQFAARRELRSLDRALADPQDPANPYLCASRYGSQLERYLDRFPAESILVLDQADLRTRRRETLRRLFSFAGVDPDFESPELDREVNVADEKLLFHDGAVRLRWFARRLPQPVKRGLQPIRRGLVRHPRLLGQPFERPQLDEQATARLAGALRPDIDRFRELTGMPFPDWSV